MSDRLYADYGAISRAGGSLRAAATTVQSPWSSLSVGLGSVSVQSALDDVSALHDARASAAQRLLDTKAASVEQAVAEMIAADQSFTRSLP
ncbi:hypothetical protein [Microbacterium lacticum]